MPTSARTTSRRSSRYVALFTLLCRRLELFGGELVFVDGSKFKAVNNRKRNFSEKRLERALAAIDEKISAYVVALDEHDRADSQTFVSKMPSAAELQKKIAALKERKAKYQTLSTELKESGEKQVSLTDPDAREGGYALRRHRRLLQRPDRC